MSGSIAKSVIVWFTWTTEPQVSKPDTCEQINLWAQLILSWVQDAQYGSTLLWVFNRPATISPNTTSLITKCMTQKKNDLFLHQVTIWISVKPEYHRHSWGDGWASQIFLSAIDSDAVLARDPWSIVIINPIDSKPRRSWRNKSLWWEEGKHEEDWEVWLAAYADASKMNSCVAPGWSYSIAVTSLWYFLFGVYCSLVFSAKILMLSLISMVLLASPLKRLKQPILFLGWYAAWLLMLGYSMIWALRVQRWSSPGSIKIIWKQSHSLSIRHLDF